MCRATGMAHSHTVLRRFDVRLWNHREYLAVRTHRSNGEDMPSGILPRRPRLVKFPSGLNADPAAPLVTRAWSPVRF